MTTGQRAMTSVRLRASRRADGGRLDDGVSRTHPIADSYRAHGVGQIDTLGELK
jgi:hypothetical protein